MEKGDDYLLGSSDYEEYEDWFGYSGRSKRSGYVTPYRSRFDWERVARSGKSYSSVFWKPSINKDKGQLITRAYTLAKEMILVMNTPGHVNIRILSEVTTDAPAFTTGQTVYVGTKVFDDVSDESEAIDIFCGLTIHEGCHLLFTDMECYKNWIRTHERKKTKDLELRKYIQNVIEDERVESELGKEKPGLLVFLEKMKNWYFDKPADMTRMKEIQKIVCTLFSVIRYPKYVKEEDIDMAFGFFDKVHEILIPLPMTTQAVLDATDEICDLLLRLYSKDETTDIDTLRKSDSADRLNEEILGKGSSAEKVLSKIRGSVFRVGQGGILSGESLLDRSEVSDQILVNGSVLGKVLEGFYEHGIDKKTIFIKSEDGWGSSREKEIYCSDREFIRPMIPSIKKILSSNNKDYTGVLHGCKSGILDTTKLAEAYQGVEHVYYRNFQVKTKKTSVCVVIDESGSMCFDYRDRRARQAAILLNEAFKNLPGVNLYIYGHSADEKTLYDDTSTDIYVYREPGVNKEYALGNSHARLENRDGTALREIAKRIRKFDQNEILMFILSDGSPSARYYRGEDAVIDTKKAVQEIEKQGFVPIQISISAHHDPSDMFTNYAMITDLSTLPAELGKLVKKAVLKAGTTSITL